MDYFCPASFETRKRNMVRHGNIVKGTEAFSWMPDRYQKMNCMYNKIMKTRCMVSVFCLFALPLFAQAEIAPGSLDNLAALLNKPALVRPVKATTLERNWYTVDLDSHMITDKASFKQIVSVLTDMENYGNIFDGRRTKLRTGIVSRGNNEMVVDITSITVAFIRFTIRYRATVRTLENTNTRFISEIRQIDSDTNDQIRGYHSIRYVEEVTVNGKKYTYIRISSLNDTYVGLRLSNIPNMIERNSFSSNEDTLNMLIDAARAR